MARAVRVEYRGAFYHVMARGNRRERIFPNEADRLLFYQTLGEACERTGWRVHAWVLMSNHYHLMVETPEGIVVAGEMAARVWCGPARVGLAEVLCLRAKNERPPYVSARGVSLRRPGMKLRRKHAGASRIAVV